MIIDLRNVKKNEGEQKSWFALFDSFDWFGLFALFAPDIIWRFHEIVTSSVRYHHKDTLSLEATMTSSPPPFPFPPTYFFPPFFSPQPNLQTRAAQLSKWSSLIQSYCRHHSLHRLTLADALLTPLFHNSTLNRHLSAPDARAVLEYMASPEGDERAEWIVPGVSVWVWWRKVEEWAGLVEGWVEETGQRGSVLTLFELAEGEGTVGQEWHGMEGEVLRKVLGSSVRRGKAQIFGAEGGEGVKFF